MADNRFQRPELDYLIYNDPLAYADLILNGDPEAYLNAVTEYKPYEKVFNSKKAAFAIPRIVESTFSPKRGLLSAPKAVSIVITTKKEGYLWIRIRLVNS